METYNPSLYIGAARGRGCTKTINVITSKLKSLGDFTGKRLLDVGCGGGTFTTHLGAGFEEVHGIDVQEEGLEKFRAAVAGDPKYIISNMSASAMDYPDSHFDTIVTIETLEHVPDLQTASAEIYRTLKPGGDLLITVPNRWFPFENHGMRLGTKEWHGRVPLLTYLPWLHRRISLARVFTVANLDTLFVPHGLKRTNVDYAWPTFEHGGNALQPLVKPLFGVMRALEASPLRMFGTSVVVRYEKPGV